VVTTSVFARKKPVQDGARPSGAKIAGEEGMTVDRRRRGICNTHPDNRVDGHITDGRRWEGHRSRGKTYCAAHHPEARIRHGLLGGDYQGPIILFRPLQKGRGHFVQKARERPGSFFTRSSANVLNDPGWPCASHGGEKKKRRKSKS